MDILRMGIESIDSFDAKSYEYRIKFLGVVFDVESNKARLIRYSITSNRMWRIRSSHKSNLAWLFDVRIEQMALFDQKSIDSIEQTVVLMKTVRDASSVI